MNTARFTRITDWLGSSAEAAKGDSTVAVVIPARDEADTVGDIVTAIATAYTGGRDAIVDELVVVDSCSIDGTAAVARRAGARVVTAARPGKGEAMWEGLAATGADLVVYLDADLEQFDPGYVPALIGPLLTDPTVELVKATYQRPLDPATSAGGGRVTELMARPLINAFFPELATVAQPLGGEYAARRSLLERLPFRCGYGVDIALLIDTARLVGVDAIAQVDLGVRRHHSSELPALGRMAADVLHTVLDRLVATGRLQLDKPVTAQLLQQTLTSAGAGWTPYSVDRSERPALTAPSLVS